jgi:hypothetical protein
MINPTAVGEEGYWALVNLIAEGVYNKDGYALRVDDELIRTLSFKQFLQFVKEKKDKIIKAKVWHLHMRLATNIVNTKYIHLWNFSDWYCSHNGVLSNTIDRLQNDSYLFFKSVKAELKEPDVAKLKKKLEKDEGYGVFLLSHKDRNEQIVIAYGKEVKMFKLNDSFIFSCDDINFDNFVTGIVHIKVAEEKKNYLGIEFEKVENMPLSVGKVKINLLAEAAVESSLMYFKDFQLKTALPLVKKERQFSCYGSSRYIGLDDDYYFRYTNSYVEANQVIEAEAAAMLMKDIVGFKAHEKTINSLIVLAKSQNRTESQEKLEHLLALDCANKDTEMEIGIEAELTQLPFRNLRRLHRRLIGD